jgi:hypothetical protein
MPFRKLLSALLFSVAPGSSGRWRALALAAATALIAAIGTWIGGQYQIGRLDALRDRYDAPVQDYAAAVFGAKKDPMEQEFLDGCKQAQIGSWLQTTDALDFMDPISGNRVQVRLDPEKSYVDLNGKEVSACVQDEVEARQFDIGSMTNTWAVILFLIALGLGGWAALIWRAGNLQRARNIYAETLAEQFAEAEPVLETTKNAEEVPASGSPDSSPS